MTRHQARCAFISLALAFQPTVHASAQPSDRGPFLRRSRVALLEVVDGPGRWRAESIFPDGTARSYWVTCNIKALLPKRPDLANPVSVRVVWQYPLYGSDEQAWFPLDKGQRVVVAFDDARSFVSAAGLTPL